MKSKFLLWLSENWKKNQGTNYPQTWYYMPPRWSRKAKYLNSNKVKHHLIGYPLRRFLEFLCGLFGGHELSKTEWGYGGGLYADRWCRWCDKLIQVPKESIYFQFKDSDPMGLMKNVGLNVEDRI